MKKIIFSLLAIAALASCAKTEPVFTQDNSEIKIAPVTSMTTKANVNGVIDETTYPADEDFNVYAYWANKPAGSNFEVDETNSANSAYLYDVTFVNKGLYWGGETTQYWPKNGSLRFAAYSPSDLPATVAHDLAADRFDISGLTYPVSVDGTYDILVTPTSKSYTAQTAAANVSVVFEHALSWITFQLKSTEAANAKFTVTDVIVNDVNNHGNLVADMKAGTKTWTTAMPQKFVVFNDANGSTVTTTEKVYENGKGKSVLVLPQPTTTVTIKFTQEAVGDAPALVGQEVTIPLTLDQDEPWVAGKHYTYTVIFDLDEILINPSVEDWEEVTVPEIDATATEAANQEELQAAVAAGRNVRLTDNINLTAPIEIGNSVVTKAAGPVSVVIDLNGKNIIAESSDAIVVDNGASLEINGDGKVWAATNNASSANAVWVKHGNVTINGGNYYVGKDGAKRNDCIYIGAAAYVADAASKVSTVTINGGRFEAAAQEYNQYWVLNIRDEFTSSKFYVKGGEFVNFDPSNNVSEGANTNFVADGYASYELEAGVWTVVSKAAETVVNTEAALRDAAAQGGKVVLGSDITVTESVMVAEGKELTLNLNGHNITNTNAVEDFGKGEALISYGTLTINGVGTVSSSTMAVWARGNANANITINGGTYKGCAEGFAKSGRAVAYASGGATITINGGTFEALAADKTSYANKTEGVFAALNVYDNGGNINVYGGTFVKFNPAVPGTEPKAWNEVHPNGFVATGYKSVKDGDNYTVMAE